MSTAPTTPTWIASLKDPVIKADMTAAAASGVVSEAGMAKLFNDLAAELTANKTTLSASQLADLKAIVTNLNVGETASSYLAYVTNALVNGSAANAKWTGGGASAASLGNLGVGSTATQIQELDGKWLLGSDMPSSAVSMSGVSPFSIHYSAASNPVFGTGGPSMNDINQGYLGDYYLLSSLAEVAKQDPGLIQSMITNNGNGTYGVRFFVNGVAEYVTVNTQLANGGTIFNHGTDIWASLVEKAYAQLQASGVVTGNSINFGNSYTTIGNGGAPECALEEVTNASAITDFDASGSSWSKYVFNNTLTTQSATGGMTTASVLSLLRADLAAGDDAVLSSNTNATDGSGKTTLVASHAMSIYGFDGATNELEIRNPWGSATGQSWDTTFEVSLNTLLADRDTITVDNMNTPSASVTNGALVSSAASLQANAQISAFTISDSAANVTAGLAKLNADTKLAALTVAGTAGVDTLNLASSAVEATISLGGDPASVGAGLNAASLNFTGTPDAITLGSGASTINYALLASSGIETISNFQYGADQLDLNLEGASASALHAANTTVNGAHAVSIYSGSDPDQGVVLLGLPSTMTAANLLSSHTTYNNGMAIIT